MPKIKVVTLKMSQGKSSCGFLFFDDAIKTGMLTAIEMTEIIIYTDESLNTNWCIKFNRHHRSAETNED